MKTKKQLKKQTDDVLGSPYDLHCDFDKKLKKNGFVRQKHRYRVLLCHTIAKKCSQQQCKMKIENIHKTQILRQYKNKCLGSC